MIVETEVPYKERVYMASQTDLLFSSFQKLLLFLQPEKDGKNENQLF